MSRLKPKLAVPATAYVPRTVACELTWPESAPVPRRIRKPDPTMVVPASTVLSATRESLAAMVTVAPVATRRRFTFAVPLWTDGALMPTPEMKTLVVESGTVPVLQLVAVFQSVLVVPNHWLANPAGRGTVMLNGAEVSGVIPAVVATRV